MKTPQIASVSRLRALLLAVAVMILPAVGLVRADLNHEQVAAAKAATGLLVTSTGSGTAFCVSESGLFVTCDHVIEGAKEDSIAIVISPTGKEEKRYPAKIVKRLKEPDLAVLKVTLDRKVPVLKLGDVASLYETQQLYAFGYPFGKALAVDEKSYPSISVNVGRITSLRKKNEVLDVIQLDAQVNPGNSGGPVLDENGTVVGIISSGVVASGINFAIPVSVLSKGVEAPIITVTPAGADKKHPSKPLAVAISVDWLFPPPQEPKVVIEVHAGEGPPRIIETQKAKDGTFQAEVSASKEANKPEKPRLQVALIFENGWVEGTTPDREISIGGKPKALREIGELKRVEGGNDFLADGKPAGSLPEMKAWPIDVGGMAVTVDASKATRIEIEPPAASEPAAPTYKAVVKLADGREFSSEEKVLGSFTAASIPPPVLQGKVNLTDTREIALPAPVTDVVAAENGRVLLLPMKGAKKLAVFDVLNLSIRGYISLEDEDSVIAGGARYILVVSPGQNLIHRYSVETLEKERTISNSFGRVASLTMGRSSPRIALMIAGADAPGQFKVMAFDAEKMAVTATAEQNMAMRMYNTDVTVRASADGRTYGVVQQMLSPSGFNILTIRDNTFEDTYEHVSCGLLVPNADGSEIFTSMGGIYTDKYVAVVKADGNWTTGLTYLPSYHPMYYFSVPYSNTEGTDAPIKIGIYLQGNAQALLEMSEPFKEMFVRHTVPGVKRDPVSTDKRYHFYPQLDLILTIPPTNDKIVARPLNVRALLDKKGIDYLYVASSAPLGKVSTPYHYKLEAATRAGGAKFTLQSGPAGLTVNGDGEVAWNAPAEPTDETVIVSLKDASGQETFHTFHVVITE